MGAADVPIIEGPGRITEADVALVRHHHALKSLERTFPQLVRFGGQVARLLESYAAQKGLDPAKIAVPAAYWRADGWLLFELDPEESKLHPGQSTKFEARSFGSLRDLDMRYPEAVGIVFRLANQLTSYANQHQLMPAEVEFKRASIFHDGKGQPGLKVKVFHRGQALRPKKVVL